MPRALRTGRAALVLLTASFLLQSGCMHARGATAQQKRDYVTDMRDQTLTDLYAENPALRTKVEDAPGYAVFSDLAGGVLFLSTGEGYGVVHDNRTGRDTYMKMAELGAGFGLGMRHFRAVYVFNDASHLRTFVDEGWEFGADVNAAAIVDDQGAAGGVTGDVVGGGVTSEGSGSIGADRDIASGANSAGTGIDVYQITEDGLIARGTVAGTKYWKDTELN